MYPFLSGYFEIESFGNGYVDSYAEIVHISTSDVKRHEHGHGHHDFRDALLTQILRPKM